jgi:hypothetical protein
VVHLAEDAGVQQERDTLACRPGVNTQASDGKLMVTDHVAGSIASSLREVQGSQ